MNMHYFLIHIVSEGKIKPVQFVVLANDIRDARMKILDGVIADDERTANEIKEIEIALYNTAPTIIYDGILEL